MGMCSNLFMKQKIKFKTIICTIVDHDLLQQEQNLIWKIKCDSHYIISLYDIKFWKEKLQSCELISSQRNMLKSWTYDNDDDE
jgi:hypothetical protein